MGCITFMWQLVQESLLHHQAHDTFFDFPTRVMQVVVLFSLQRQGDLRYREVKGSVSVHMLLRGRVET